MDISNPSGKPMTMITRGQKRREQAHAEPISVQQTNTSPSKSKQAKKSKQKKQPGTPPPSPPTPFVEEEVRVNNKQKAIINNTNDKHAKDKQKQASYKQREKQCKYRPANYTIQPSMLRGKIDRRLFYKIITLTAKDENKAVIQLSEGTHMHEYTTDAWLEVKLMHISAGGTHVILHTTVPNSNDATKEYPLSNITEIKEVGGWDEQATITLFATLAAQSAQKAAAAKPPKAEVSTHQAEGFTTLKKADREVLADMQLKISSLVSAHMELLDAVHKLFEEFSKFRTQVTDMYFKQLQDQARLHSEQMVECFKARKS